MKQEIPEVPDVMGLAVNILEQLQSFFSRVDTKSSVILSVDTAMLGYLASKLPSFPLWDAYMLAAIVPVILIAASLVQLYRCSFPRLTGGQESLVFFKEIAKRTEARFIADFLAQSQSDLSQDLLGQVWRNSAILTDKFICLKSAYALCAWAVIPWGCAIAIFVTR